MRVVSALLPRGAAPSDEAKYSAATFRCFDGSGGSLPPSAINDDFCDCVDGSDEPGTGACAGQESPLFFCLNAGSTARQLYASRVGDGICDCCDGSDEASLAERRGQAVACTDVCVEHGKLEAEKLQKRSEMVQKGVAKQHATSQAAILERANMRWTKARLEKKLPGLEAKYEEAKKRAAAIRQAELREKEESLEKAAEEPAKPEDVPPVAEEAAPADDAADEVKPPVSEYAKWMDGAEATLSEGEAAADASGDDAQVSEYAKWMDGAESALAGEKEDVETEDVAESFNADDEEDVLDDDDYELKRLEREGGKSSGNITEEEACRREMDAARREIEALEKKLTALGEEHLAYASLEDKELSKHVQEFKYKLKFFQKADQDWTSLGSWAGFTGPHTAHFTGGATCWEGPARSLTVTFECGDEEALVDVTEPSRCVYAATVVHPAACDPTELETLSMDTRVIGPRDRDEL